MDAREDLDSEHETRIDGWPYDTVAHCDDEEKEEASAVSSGVEQAFGDEQCAGGERLAC